ncbi:MAG: hypothetical protein ABEK84_01100 [Salinibacter sp.]
MHPPASRSVQSNAPSPNSTDDSFPAVQLPLESPPSDLEEAVRKLRQRPSKELHRAHKHHRRALKALRNDAYDALPESTRERLIQRFQTNLTALNAALEPEQTADDEESPQSRSSSSLVQKALTWLW